MSLSSIPGSFLTDKLTSTLTLHNSNTNIGSGGGGNPHINTSSNHNHYHSFNQYHHHTSTHNNNQHDSSGSFHSKLLNAPSYLFRRQFNRSSSSISSQQQQQQGLERPQESHLFPTPQYSNSVLSFLYSNGGGGAFSPTLPSLSEQLQPSSSSTTSPYSTTDFPMSLDDSVQDAFVEGSHLWALLVVGYSIVFTIGVIGNSVLLAALCGTGGRARALPVRNHLMVNLALADLLVTGICVPISACAAASHACWPSLLVSWMCQLGPLLQRTPVAASTLSLALLSLDRWAAIRHPRFAQRFRERRFVGISMLITWAIASLVAAPTFWVRQWNNYNTSSETHPFTAPSHEKGSLDQDSDEPENSRNSSSTSWGEQWDDSGVCIERWTNIGIQLAYAATYLGTAFVSPALIVAACHASVSHKLTAQLKVLSGATSGDRLTANRARPKQVLIVARDPSNNIIPNPLSPPPANRCGGDADSIGGGMMLPAVSRSGSLDYPRQCQSRKFVPCDPNSDDENDVFVRMQIEADLESFRQLSKFQSHRTDKAPRTTRRGAKLLSTFRSHLSSEPNSGSADNNNTLKALKRETSIIRAHRKLRKKLNVSSAAIPLSSTRLAPAPTLPTYSSQSFRSRRRAANLLAALAAVFVFCWAPYVACAILEMFLVDKSLVRQLIPFALFLGHAHSAINPVVSWRLNRSAFVRFQRQSLLSLLPEWFRSCCTCRLFCYSCTCSPTCCDNSPEEFSSTPGPRTNQQRPPLRRAGTQYPVLNHQNPFLTPHQPHLQQPRRLNRSSPHRRPGGSFGRNTQSRSSCPPNCCWKGDDDSSDDGNSIPCCCCFCSNRMYGRSSSPDIWNRNSSTNEAALGAFHPKYLSRLPAPDPVSKCHTSNFFR